MYFITAKNYREALFRSLEFIKDYGVSCAPRGLPTSELEDVVIHVKNPKDRIPLVKGRRANIFALLAEVVWVLSGRNDLDFIGYYLRRIHEFSDDGIVLHGAYGPRLRNWQGVDQIFSVYHLLKNMPSTRRAAIVLFDPTRDFDSNRKDIPCNNWLHFTIRNKKLNLRVASRSMDVIWGSTLNFFEWTILQELLASWLDVSVGTYTHFIGSLHLYYNFLKRATEILSAPLDLRYYKQIAIDIPVEKFDVELEQFAKLEHGMRLLQEPLTEILDSKWLRIVAQMLWSYSLHKNAQYERAWNVLMEIPDCDLKAAGIDFYSRNANYSGLIHGQN